MSYSFTTFFHSEKYAVLKQNSHRRPDKLLPKKYSNRIFYVAFINLSSAALALYYKQWDFLTVVFGVMCNSLNYWRHPTNGLRRKVDMTWVFIGCTYQMAKSMTLEIEYLIAYWLAVVLAISSYALARYYGRTKLDFDTSSRVHTGIHFFGNLSNIILYIGYFRLATASI